MSLDVFVANSLDEAALTHRGAAITPQNHKCLMMYASQSEFPMLMRMSDYLADALFGTAETPFLLGEMLRIENLVPMHSATQECIHRLIETCRQAIEYGRGLYAVCD